MRIGLTYDLRSEYLKAGYGHEETAELDREDTIEAIERAIGELGHTTDRIGHGRRLAERLVAGDRWDLVFNIAEGIRGAARESQVPALLDLYGVPYTFSDPLVLGVCLHKGLTKLVVEKAGVVTPWFTVVDPGVGQRFDDEDVPEDLPLPVFIKPVAEGTSKGVTGESLVKRREDLARRVRVLVERYAQPVLIESYLSGREFTVGIVGTGAKAEVLGTLEVEVVQAVDGAEEGFYSYENKKAWETCMNYRLVRASEDPEVKSAEALALVAWRALGCRDGGRVDVRSDDRGIPQFLEANPLAGLNPEISDLPILGRQLGLSYGELIRRILESAMERVSSARRIGVDGTS